MKLKDYIENGFNSTIRIPNEEESTKGIPLIKPFTVPCNSLAFRELYYWDTYFINRGMILLNNVEVAKNNIENFIFLINKLGYVPNGNKNYLNRSQPPLFGMMVSDYYSVSNDKEFLKVCVDALKKEMLFWEQNRKSENGLNFYSCNADSEELKAAVKMYKDRTAIDREWLEEFWGKNILAEAESGWDFNERFNGKCEQYNPVDLNSILYFNERFLDYAEMELGIKSDINWLERAYKRKLLMEKYMLSTDGVFYDYSYVDNSLSKVVSAASFFPYYVKMADDGQGLKKLLENLELPFGIQASISIGEGIYQWGAKNGWPCLQLIAVEGLLNYERKGDAKRIAYKYVDLVKNVYKNTGRIWEKYNVENYNESVVAEYNTPEMFGWTAGCYLVIEEIIKKNWGDNFEQH